MTPGVVAVFGSSKTVPGSSEWSVAEEVGRRIAQSGHSVITGGYGGTMEAASKGASDQGGHVVGVTSPALFPGRSGANPYVDELIEAPDLIGRLGQLITRADGVIALPGSIGTAAELLVAWNHNWLSRRNGQTAIPTVAVGPGWRSVVDAMVEQNRAEAGDIHLVDRADEAVTWVLERIAGTGDVN